MKYKIKTYSIWEPGQRVDSEGRPHQEDSISPSAGTQADDCRTFILCDGMGGHQAGEVASATVCETMSQAISGNSHDGEGVFTDADLSSALESAYRALDTHDSANVHKMGTTMTLLKLHNAGATMAHIGDSRIWHIRPGKTAAETEILYQSEDHSLVNSLIKMGEMTREQARTSPQKHVITRAMQPGIDSRCKATVYKTADICPGDFFYMCSDGMLERDDMDDGSRLKEIFADNGATDDASRVKILIDETASNSDNHTAFIIRVTDVIDAPAEAERKTDSKPAEDTPEPRHISSNKLFLIICILAFIIGVIMSFII